MQGHIFSPFKPTGEYKLERAPWSLGIDMGDNVLFAVILTGSESRHTKPTDA